MKKLLLLASVTALLAAGCNNSTQTAYQATSTAPVVTSQPAPTSSPVNTPAPITTPAPTGTNILAIINVSGSTNTFPYSITVYQDGSAKAAVEGSTSSETLPPKTVNIVQLQGLLNQIGDVSKIANGSCAKSVSFGTTTTISYNGNTSGDLQCLKDDSTEPRADKDLAAFVANLQAEVKINTSRVHMIPLSQ
jgi:hypothetical protein